VKRLEELELAALRAHVADMGDPLPKQLLEAIRLAVRQHELRMGAELQCERMRQSFLEAGALLRQAVALLESAEGQSEEWLHARGSILAIWKSGGN